MAVIKYRKHRCQGHNSVRRKLALAVASLLANPIEAQTNDSYDDKNWQLDFSQLRYSENGYIDVDKSIFNIAGNMSEKDSLNVDLVVDTMTGSTPTGALPQIYGGSAATSGVQTITTASGVITLSSGGAGEPAREVVSVAHFEDDRVGVNVEWQHEYTRDFRMNYGASYSDENDYYSTGVKVQAEIDDEKKLTTYTFGMAFTDDEITRVGSDAVPVPLSSVTNMSFTSKESLEALDVLFGLSKVLSERSLIQVNLSISDSDGYHTDPYKVINTADANLNAVDLLFEKRPDARQRNILYGQYIRQTHRGNNWRLSYRYYDDDWKITSHTIESSYRFNFKNGNYLEPQLRQYQQSKADFYYRSLNSTDPMPEYASSDHRLSDAESLSIGIKAGFKIGDNGQLRIRAENYDQSFDDAVIKKNSALIFQISYKRTF